MAQNTSEQPTEAIRDERELHDLEKYGMTFTDRRLFQTIRELWRENERLREQIALLQYAD